MAFDEEMAPEGAPELPPPDAEAEEPANDIEMPGAVPEEEMVEPPPPNYDSDPNLAKLLPHSFLTSLAARVKQAADDSYKSFEGWRQNTAENLRLYNGDVPDAGADQKNITPVHLPYAKRAVRIFFSKLFPQLYPPTGEIVALKVRSAALQPVADRCSAHMNFQLLNDVPEYIPSHDRGMKQLLIEGSIFETWRYDILQKRAVQEIFLAENFWIPYAAKTDRPDMADVPYKTLIQTYQQHQLEELEAADYYIGVTKPFPHSDGGTTNPIYGAGSYDESGTPTDASGGLGISARDKPVKDTADQNTGVEEQIDDPDRPRRILEQDRMVKLPGEQAARMVTVCLDEASMQILRVSFCEMEDLKDKARHAAETQVWEQQTAAQEAMHQEALAQHQEAAGMAGLPHPVTGEPLPHPGEPPAPPPPLPPPAPVRKIPWHRHTKYDCDMNPEGALGHGIVDDVKGHNLLANKIATRGVSLMTLNMLPTGLSSRQSKFGREETPLQLGKINETGMSAEQLAATNGGVHFLQFPPPDPTWNKVLEIADQSAQEVTAFDIAAGAPGMSGETATESEMRHSNATDNISAIGARVNRGRAWSLRNLAYINSVTLPDEGVVIYRDVGDGGGVQPVTVTRQDYEAILGELEVSFTCDPNFESKPLKEKRAGKRLQSLQAFINEPNAIGMPVVDPITAIDLLRKAAVDYLKTVDAPGEWLSAIMNSPKPQIPGINAPLPPEPPPGQGANPNGPPPGPPRGMDQGRPPGPPPAAGGAEAPPPPQA